MAFLTVTSTDRHLPITDSLARRKLLVIELWGIGDLTMATPLLAAAVEKYEVTLLAKPHARALLAATFPELKFIEWDAPWTVFTGKYRLWRWDWAEVRRVVGELRRLDPDVAVSVRDDPRDHFIMRLAGARRRVGFPTHGSRVFLSDPICRDRESQHKVEDWRSLTETLQLGVADERSPALVVPDAVRRSKSKMCLHVGARISVRRWPLAYFADLIARLRTRFTFHLTIVPDPDGYGLELAPLADEFLPKLELDRLVSLLATYDILICNDSAPGHLAAAVGTPVLAFFGPSDPVRYRPWGDDNHVVIRDICPHRPCFDYCKFPEPYCMTRLTPEVAWPEIEKFVARHLETKVGRS